MRAGDDRAEGARRRGHRGPASGEEGGARGRPDGRPRGEPGRGEEGGQRLVQRERLLPLAPPAQEEERMSTAAAVKIGAKRLDLSNLDKVLYPQVGFTKGQVIDYYMRIAPVILPH